MAAHVRSCRKRYRTSVEPLKPTGGPVSTIFLYVQGSPRHWLYLEVSARETLADLDAFLRRTWLECCGHLSEFVIDGARYTADCGDGGGDWDDFDLDTPGKMTVRLDAVLRPGMTFQHIYDLGSTTECRLRVLGAGEAPRGEAQIRMQARNDEPVFLCVECRAPATQLCTECMWDGESWLCHACSRSHACDEEMRLPVVDSPRVGTCTYGA